jgi:hypothetical protein
MIEGARRIYAPSAIGSLAQSKRCHAREPSDPWSRACRRTKSGRAMRPEVTDASKAFPAGSTHGTLRCSSLRVLPRQNHQADDAAAA